MASHWADATPYNVLHADRLLEMFPTARIIHVYRDPRDVLSSYLTKTWGGNDALIVAERIACVYERWFAVRERLPPHSFREIALEQFVAAPAQNMHSLLEFVGVKPYELPYAMVSTQKANCARWVRDDAVASPKISECLQPIITRLGYDVDAKERAA